MQILLDTFVLCNGDARGSGKKVGPDGLSLSRSSQVQTVNAIRAAEAVHIDRGNKSGVISFSVTITRSTHAEAFAQALSLYHEVPTSGRLTYDSKGIGQACCDLNVPLFTGCTFTVTYTLKLSGTAAERQ